MRKAILMCAILALCGAAQVEQPKQEQKGTLANGELLNTATAVRGDILIVDSHSSRLVTIHPDGTIEYGKGYTPDKAAKIFWEALGRDMPCKELRK